jgi:hypothetical protein
MIVSYTKLNTIAIFFLTFLTPYDLSMAALTFNSIIT